LVVQLRRFAYVLPWFRFVYAEGDDSTVLIVIGAHMIKVEGYGLSALLCPLAGHRVARLIQPTGNEAKFGVRGLDAESVSGPGITSISVDVPEEGQ